MMEYHSLFRSRPRKVSICSGSSCPSSMPFCFEPLRISTLRLAEEEVQTNMKRWCHSQFRMRATLPLVFTGTYLRRE